MSIVVTDIARVDAQSLASFAEGRIGVLGAISAAAACALEKTTAYSLISRPPDGRYDAGHSAGKFDVDLSLGEGGVVGAALVRTARRLMRGEVYVPATLEL